MTTADTNLSLLASARAIVEARRGPMPDALPRRAHPASTAEIVAWMERDSARDAYEREVRAVYRDLRAGPMLAPVVRISETRIAA